MTSHEPIAAHVILMIIIMYVGLVCGLHFFTPLKFVPDCWSNPLGRWDVADNMDQRSAKQHGPTRRSHKQHNKRIKQERRKARDATCKRIREDMDEWSMDERSFDETDVFAEIR